MHDLIFLDTVKFHEFFGITLHIFSSSESEDKEDQQDEPSGESQFRMTDGQNEVAVVDGIDAGKTVSTATISQQLYSIAKFKRKRQA